MGQSESRPQEIPSGCPMHNQQQKPTINSGSQCPVVHDKGTSENDNINPLNNMPNVDHVSTSPGQKMYLPTDRTVSSIPRPKNNENDRSYGSGEKWEYPSPQQFYNALVRKGWETPEESIEDMVAIHNFLNEEAWNEIIKWENRVEGNKVSNVQLAKFQGRPKEYTPKARIQMLLSTIFPNRFSDEPPFDRHDWYIKRKSSDELVRYVIDYYGAPSTPEGMPVFHLDVRPALDSPSSILERIRVGTARCWRTATGSEIDLNDL